MITSKKTILFSAFLSIACLACSSISFAGISDWCCCGKTTQEEERDSSRPISRPLPSSAPMASHEAMLDGITTSRASAAPTIVDSAAPTIVDSAAPTIVVSGAPTIVDSAASTSLGSTIAATSPNIDKPDADTKTETIPLLSRASIASSSSSSIPDLDGITTSRASAAPSIVDSAAPTIVDSAASTSLGSTIAATSPNIDKPDADTETETVPLLSRASIASSSSSSIPDFEMFFFSTESFLGLTLKAGVSPLIIDNHRIQEYEHGVRSIKTPNGAIIFVFPGSYIGIQAFTDEAQIPSTLSNKRSILSAIPTNVQGLLDSHARVDLESSALQIFSEQIERILSEAMKQNGVQVRVYRAQSGNFKEFLITGCPSVLLHVISGASNSSETNARRFLSDAFRALTQSSQE